MSAKNKKKKEPLKDVGIRLDTDASPEEINPLEPRIITNTRPGGIVRGNGEGCRVPFGQGIRNGR